MPLTTPSIQPPRESTSFDSSWRLASPDRLERALPLLIFVLSFAYLCIFRRYTTLEPDEGIVLQGAERILAGQIPYRDFFSFYTPGSLYLIASLFRIFGDSFAVARTSLAAAGAICSAITYVLARRVCSRGMALFVAVLATTAGAAFRFLVLHNPYSTAGCCLALYCAVRFVETRWSGWAFAAGSLIAVTSLLEQSKGAGLFLGVVLGFLLLKIMDRGFHLVRVPVLSAVIGFGWPFAITFSYFGSQHAFALMVKSWMWPLAHYTQANQVPYGYQNWSDRSREILFHTGPVWLRIVKMIAVSPGLLIPVLPLVGVGLLVFFVIHFRADPENSVRSRYYVLTCSVIAGLLLSVVIARADILHFMYLAPIWYLVLAWVMEPLGTLNRIMKRVRIPINAFVATAFSLLSMAVLFSVTGATNRIETRRGLITTSERDTVIPYVQGHIAPGAEMLVYPYLPLYNFLTDTRSPSRYDYFQPGMNTMEQSQEILSSLKSSQAPALLEPWFAEKIATSWPETSIASIASDPVAEYLAKNYRVCRLLASPEGWRFQFMVRKEMACQ